MARISLMKMLPRCWIVVLLAVLAVPTRAAPSRKVVMAIVPAVSLNDLASKDLPNLRKLMNSGAVGLMNSRTAGRVQEEKLSESEDPRRASESGYLTIGAGARAIAGSDAAQTFNRNETVDGDPAWVVLKRLTLVDPKTSEVVHTRIVRLIRANAALNHAVSVGMLGSTIHKARLKTAVVGSSDDGAIHREAALICMDAHGLVDLGDVGAGMTVRDPRSPSGVRMSEPGLLREAARCIRLADFTVIELGDTAQLDRARLDLMDDIYPREKAQVLRRTDALIGKLMRLLDLRTTTLIVLSPYPSSEALEKSPNSLCPVMISGPGIARGFLISGSTRVRGLVTNTDIAPTILSALGVSMPKGLVGRAVSSKPHESPIRALIGMNERVSRQAAAMPVLRQAMVGVIVLVGIITALWWILPVGRPTRRKLLPTMVLIPAAIAPAMMILALRPVGSQMVTWVYLIASVGVIVALCSIIGWKPLSALMLISLGASALLLGDLAVGNPLCRFSIMGYSIIEGARYYGIGNELMGALIGSSIVGLGLLLGSLRVGPRAVRIVLFLAMIVVTASVGAPMLGANVGGAIAVVFGYCSALAATSKKPFDLRRIMAVIGLLAAVIVIFAVLDSLRGQQLESHLGRAIRAAKEGGFGGIGELASRKLAMNWLLIRYALWSRLLAAYILSAGFALFVRLRRSAKPMPAHVRIALAGAIGGALAALVFNDSGIVAAATAFAYPWALILLAILDSEPHKGHQRNREPA